MSQHHPNSCVALSPAPPPPPLRGGPPCMLAKPNRRKLRGASGPVATSPDADGRDRHSPWVFGTVGEHGVSVGLSECFFFFFFFLFFFFFFFFFPFFVCEAMMMRIEGAFGGDLEELLDQLLAGRDPKDVFNKDTAGRRVEEGFL